jgi:hypothetical protein
MDRLFQGPSTVLVKVDESRFHRYTHNLELCAFDIREDEDADEVDTGKCISMMESFSTWRAVFHQIFEMDPFSYQ